jgi:hypothetical protein
MFRREGANRSWTTRGEAESSEMHHTKEWMIITEKGEKEYLVKNL